WSFTPSPLLLPSLKALGNGLRLARIIGPPTALISEPHFPSKEANRLGPAFFAVKGKFLDRPDSLARGERVKQCSGHDVSETVEDSPQEKCSTLITTS
ncbi:hypothetical protein AVEN_161430-1, partial [Araneus ventricosus]